MAESIGRVSAARRGTSQAPLRASVGARRDARAAGQPFAPVSVGIGLNTGPCCVGNLGSERRFDYSAIGDDVNLASRLEALTKSYGVPVIAGERTAENIALLEDLCQTMRFGSLCALGGFVPFLQIPRLTAG